MTESCVYKTIPCFAPASRLVLAAHIRICYLLSHGVHGFCWLFVLVLRIYPLVASSALHRSVALSPHYYRFCCVSSEQLGVLLMQLFFAVTGAQGSLAVVMGTAPSLLVFSLVQVCRLLTEC